MATDCSHLEAIHEVEPRTMGCEECLKLGVPWVLLRMCRTCGHVGCCDTSRFKHATAHFHATGHPIVQLLEHAEERDWCYVDAAYVGRTS